MMVQLLAWHLPRMPKTLPLLVKCRDTRREKCLACAHHHSRPLKHETFIKPVLFQCWYTVYGAGPTLKQHWPSARVISGQPNLRSFVTGSVGACKYQHYFLGRFSQCYSGQIHLVLDPSPINQPYLILTVFSRCLFCAPDGGKQQ